MRRTSLAHLTFQKYRQDAVKLAALMKERLGEHPTMINFVDPVMGAHGGPGVLAVFLKCKVRE